VGQGERGEVGRGGGEVGGGKIDSASWWVTRKGKEESLGCSGVRAVAEGCGGVGRGE